MFEGARVAVVVPAYNEELLIGRVIETMPDFVDLIVVVDDHSGDRTAEVVESYGERLGERLVLLRHEVNRGVGAAIVSGYRLAQERGMDVVAVMAGDAQMDPAELPLIMGPVVRGEVDYVKGNRLFTGEAWRLIPRYRYLGNAFLSLLTKIASGYWHVADSQTGYTAISRRALEMLPLEKLYPRYGYPNHLLVMLNIYGMRVRDVPVRPIYNIGEKSGIRLSRVIPRLSWLLGRCFLWRMWEKYVIRDFHPLVFFYALAFFLLLAAFVLGVRMSVVWAVTGLIPRTNALALMSSAIAGLQSLFFAMWFDMEYNRTLR